MPNKPIYLPLSNSWLVLLSFSQGTQSSPQGIIPVDVLPRRVWPGAAERANE